jgi:excisionase family DNA binding protein
VVLAEAAERIGVTPATLRQQLSRGKLAGVKVGRDWFVSAAEIARYKKRVARSR